MEKLTWLLFMYTSWSPGKIGFLLFGVLGFSGSGFVLTFALLALVAGFKIKETHCRNIYRH